MHCCTWNLSQWGYFIRDDLLISSAEWKTPAPHLLQWGEKKKYLLTGVEHDTVCECLSLPLPSFSQCAADWLSAVDLITLCLLAVTQWWEADAPYPRGNICMSATVCVSVFLLFVFSLALSTAYMSLSHLRVRALLCLSARLSWEELQRTDVLTASTLWWYTLRGRVPNMLGGLLESSSRWVLSRRQCFIFLLRRAASSSSQDQTCQHVTYKIFEHSPAPAHSTLNCEPQCWHPKGTRGWMWLWLQVNGQNWACVAVGGYRFGYRRQGENKVKG